MSPHQDPAGIPSTDSVTSTVETKTLPPAKDSSIFKVHYISPTSPNLPFLAGKFSALRLLALSISPEAFGSKFKVVSKRTPTKWQSFLTRPNFHTFVCSRYEADPERPNGPYDLEQGQWVAHISIIGPIPKKEYDLYPPSEGADESGSDAEESKWNLTALWTDPTFRGQGIAKKLTLAAVDFAANYDSGSVKRARMRLYNRGGPANEHVLAMYRNLGFKNAGGVSLFEAMIGNGDSDEIPDDILEAGNFDRDENTGDAVLKGGMWYTRVGVSMDRVIECA